MKCFGKNCSAFAVAYVGETDDFEVEPAVVQFLNSCGRKTGVIQENVHEQLIVFANAPQTQSIGGNNFSADVTKKLANRRYPSAR